MTNVQNLYQNHLRNGGKLSFEDFSALRIQVLAKHSVNPPEVVVLPDNSCISAMAIAPDELRELKRESLRIHP